MTKTRLLPVMALALTLLLPGPAAQAILEEAVEEISGPGGDDSE